MAISLEQFVRQLVSSGLMSEAELSDYQDTFPPEKRLQDAGSLADHLVCDGKLTEYQAKAILEDKPPDLMLGEYKLLHKLGKGGMGEVFKAMHRHLERFAAIKVLRPEMLESDAAVRRFRQEVKTAGRLSHSNIVATYDAGDQNGVHYMVMEYVDGCDLAVLVKRDGPMSLPQALDCTIQAARGLAYAHGRNVVHRDIKPANLLLDKDGNIKILDMGLARVTESDDAAVGATMAERLTRTGQMLGTVDYVSPEQAADTRSADHRSDVYSLGCTLFSLLTGKPVYSGDTAMTKLIAHCEAKIPSLPDALPGAPAKLDRVFAKMLAKRPEDRYQSMTEVIAALEACLGPESPAEQAAGASSQPAEAAPGRDGGSAAPAPEPAKQPACKLTTKAAAMKTVTIEDSVGSDDDLTRTQREQPTIDGYQATVRDRPVAIGVERLPPGGGRVNMAWLLVGVGVAVLLGAVGLAYWLLWFILG